MAEESLLRKRHSSSAGVTVAGGLLHRVVEYFACTRLDAHCTCASPAAFAITADATMTPER
jgi:hypothetical protein